MEQKSPRDTTISLTNRSAEPSGPSISDSKVDDSKSEATSSDSEPETPSTGREETKVGSPWVRRGPRRRRGELDKDAADAKEQTEDKLSAKPENNDDKLVKRAQIPTESNVLDLIPDLDEEAADALVTGGATEAPEERVVRAKTLPKWGELRDAAKNHRVLSGATKEIDLSVLAATLLPYGIAEAEELEAHMDWTFETLGASIQHRLDQLQSK